MMNKLIKFYILFLTVLSIFSASGELDTTFGTGGIVTTIIGSGSFKSDVAYSVAIQSDGKIVVTGSSYNGGNDFALVRYNTNGSLDTKVTTSNDFSADVAYSVAIQSDGKIVVAGSSDNNGSNNDFALVRYNTNGSLDTTFNSTGIVTTAIGSNTDVANSVAIQSDGKIVVAGYSYNGSNNDFALVRYNTDGSLDTTFNSTGIVTTAIGSSTDAANSVAIQSDGKIVVAGYSNNGSDYDFALVRYNTDGSLDTTFNSTGIVTTAIVSSSDYANSVAIQSDGKIVVAGYSWNGTSNVFAVARYYGCDSPIITTDPSSQTKCSGESVTFSVVATGAPLTYQWKKDGTTISGATSSSYTINSVSDSDGADYTVVVTNSCGSTTSAAATLTVNDSPTITTDPSSQTKCSGESVTFSVVATGTAPLTYQWKKDGTTISGATSSSYTINPVSDSDGADYTVVVTNSCGSSTSDAATLTVNDEPTITTQPESQTKCSGESVTFSVVATGTTPFT